ncbi:glycosyltransferase, partial [Campylobacter sp. RM12642]|nr:glycosyltransferase [Campylobacter sp. RM12642]
EYANKDSRIKIIHNKENLKLLHARAEGVKVATSDLIMFLDPDDELELNACEILYIHYNNEFKLLRCNFSLIGFDETYNLNVAHSYDEYIQLSGKHVYYDFLMWGVLINKQLYLDCLLLVEEYGLDNINFIEDVTMGFLLINKTNNYSYIENKLYKYYKNTNSLTNSSQFDLKLKLRIINMIIRFFNTMKNKYPQDFNNKIYISNLYMLIRLKYKSEKELNCNIIGRLLGKISYEINKLKLKIC